MARLNYTKVLSLIINKAKTAADSAFAVVGPGEQDPDTGEVASIGSVDAFARVLSVSLEPVSRRLTRTTQTASVTVTALVVATDKASDPINDPAAQIDALCNALEYACLTDSTGGVNTTVTLDVASVEEATGELAKAVRAVLITVKGEAKAEG